MTLPYATGDEASSRDVMKVGLSRGMPGARAPHRFSVRTFRGIPVSARPALAANFGTLPEIC